MDQGGTDTDTMMAEAGLVSELIVSLMDEIPQLASDEHTQALIAQHVLSIVLDTKHRVTAAKDKQFAASEEAHHEALAEMDFSMIKKERNHHIELKEKTHHIELMTKQKHTNVEKIERMLEEKERQLTDRNVEIMEQQALLAAREYELVLKEDLLQEKEVLLEEDGEMSSIHATETRFMAEQVALKP